MAETTSTPTGQAGDAGNSTPATNAGGVKTEATETSGTLLGSVKVPEATKDAGASGENKTTPEANPAIELKLPDGMQVDKAMLDAFMPAFQEAKLTSEQASKLAATYVAQQAAAESDLQTRVKQHQAENLASIKADKEFGGVKFAENTAFAQAAIVRFGGTEVAAELDRYGLGNNPELFKMLARVGKALAEDSSSVRPAANGSSQLSEQEKLNKRYPSSANLNSKR